MQDKVQDTLAGKMKNRRNADAEMTDAVQDREMRDVECRCSARQGDERCRNAERQMQRKTCRDAKYRVQIHRYRCSARQPGRQEAAMQMQR